MNGLSHVPPGLLSIRGFETALSRCLRTLEGVHAGVTLFAVGWRGSAPPPPDAENAAVAALGPLGSVGRLPDGRIGLVYLGPGGGESRQSEALKGYMLDRLAARLSEQGRAESAAALRLAAAHGWTDQGTTAHRLLEAVAKVF